MSPHESITQASQLAAHGQSRFITLTNFPSPHYFEKSQKSYTITYCLNEPKIASVYWLFISSLQTEEISVKVHRSQAQVFTPNSFQNIPNKQIFST